jgi:hypothetical protein
VKYFLDTEFISQPFKVDLISIGIVAEDGREFYMESDAVDWAPASRWTLDVVRPQLSGEGHAPESIGHGIRAFAEHDDAPEFWGYYAAFDWVAFCGLFGSLGELPFDFPQFCLDLKQWAIALGDPELPAQTGQRHHALADARWTKGVWEFLAALPAP